MNAVAVHENDPIALFDDEEYVRLTLAQHLRDKGLQVAVASNPPEILDHVSTTQLSGLVLDRVFESRGDVPMRDSWIRFVQAARRIQPGLRIFLITERSEPDFQILAQSTYGVTRVLHKRCGLNSVVDEIYDELMKPSSTLNPMQRIGNAPSIVKAVRNLEIVAKPGVSLILLKGERGSGKELFARLIANLLGEELHAVAAAAIPSPLFESLIFGSIKGAFFQAENRPGLLGLGGVCFIDDVQNLSIEIQAKFLRVIQERRYCRVGEWEERPFKAVLVVATNIDLKREVEAGRMLPDFFDRLNNGYVVTIPPLRERLEDIEDLAVRTIAEACVTLHVPKARVPVLGGSDIGLLRSYAWPGNVRELQGVIKQSIQRMLAADMTFSAALESSLNALDSNARNETSAGLGNNATEASCHAKANAKSGKSVKAMLSAQKNEAIREAYERAKDRPDYIKRIVTDTGYSPNAVRQHLDEMHLPRPRRTQSDLQT